jgi:hypothetical protein
MKRVEEYLDGVDWLRGEKYNVEFHTAMVASCFVTESPEPSRKKIADIDMAQLTDNLMRDCFAIVRTEYEQLGGGDNVAKGPTLAEKLKRHVSDRFPQVRRSGASASLTV